MFRFLEEHPQEWNRLLITLKRAMPEGGGVARVDLERQLDRALLEEPLLQPYREEIIYLFELEREERLNDLDDEERLIASTVRQAIADLFGDSLVKRKDH